MKVSYIDNLVTMPRLILCSISHLWCLKVVASFCNLLPACHRWQKQGGGHQGTHADVGAEGALHIQHSCLCKFNYFPINFTATWWLWISWQIVTYNSEIQSYYSIFSMTLEGGGASLWTRTVKEHTLSHNETWELLLDHAFMALCYRLWWLCSS